MTEIGFTGTQIGCTDNQSSVLRDLLRSLGATELHHGDCIGADAKANEIANSLKIKVVLHPPTNPSKRAFCEASEIRQPKPYLDRNKDIVDDTAMLIATPKSL